MRAVDFLRAIRDGADVSKGDLCEFIGGITAGAIPDYQVTAFLMAVFLRGLSDEHTAHLTLAMRDSGQVFDLSDIPGERGCQATSHMPHGTL